MLMWTLQYPQPPPTKRQVQGQVGSLAGPAGRLPPGREGSCHGRATNRFEESAIRTETRMTMSSWRGRMHEGKRLRPTARQQSRGGRWRGPGVLRGGFEASFVPEKPQRFKQGQNPPGLPFPRSLGQACQERAGTEVGCHGGDLGDHPPRNEEPESPGAEGRVKDKP